MKNLDDNRALIINENSMVPFSFNNEDNPDLIKVKKLKQKENSSYFIIFFLVLLFILIILSLIKYNIESKKINKVKIFNLNFTKSLLDDNNYELIKLENGTEILLIQDKSTEKSSVSLVINTGYLSDIEQEGIAHFTMQYLFSKIKEKLSKELNEYFGGASKTINNFYTSFNFYCLNDGFYNILMNFGEIFTSTIKTIPKDYSHIQSAIDSEYALNSKNNINKEEHLIKYLVEGVHNNHSEEILPEGNNESFNDYLELKKKVINYINDHYYGENIKIVLFSNLKISQMRAFAIEAFNNLRKKNNTSEKTEKKQNFTTNQIISYISNDYIPYMKIIYYINGTGNNNDAYINQGYLNYLNYILKSSDNNSFYNSLKKNFSIISSINVFSNITFNNIIKYTIQVNFFYYDMFSGEELENVTKFIFNYIQYNINNFYNEKVFDFLKNEYDKALYFSDKKSNLEDYVNLLALKLFWRKGNLDYYLYDNFLPKNKSESYNYNTLISQLKINNSIIILKDISLQRCKNNFSIFKNYICKELNSKEKGSKYFSLNYSHINGTLNNIQFENSSELNLTNFINPKIYSTSYKDLIYPNILDKNEYISTNDIHKINLNDTLIIFSKLDRTFLIPKVFVNIKLFHYLSRTNGTINPFIANNIYIYLTYYIYLKLEIEEQLREATLGGNEINVIRDDDCINIQIKAFSDIVNNIIDNIINIIYNPKITMDNVKLYTLYLNNYLKQKDINTYWKFKIKNNYFFNDIIIDLKNDKTENQTLNFFNKLNNSMIVYVYFYGNIINSSLTNISTSFIERKTDPGQFMQFLSENYKNVTIDYFMELFQNISLPEENYSIYYTEGDSTKIRTVQVLYYLGDYNKDKYIKMYLLSKMLMNNDMNLKIELKLLNGLFLFFQVSNNYLGYDKLEDIIEYYFNNTRLHEINSYYENKNNETKIQKFYYLINNFVQDIYKDDSNLNERAHDVINRLFYDKIPVNNNNSNITIYNIKELKKWNPNNITDSFKYNIEQYFTKIDIIIGPKPSKENMTSKIFENNYNAKIKPLFEINTQK